MSKVQPPQTSTVARQSGSRDGDKKLTEHRLFKDIHTHVPAIIGSSFMINGSYIYHHAMCDDFDDIGWGTGYRSIQTIISWIKFAKKKPHKIPNIMEIQRILEQNPLKDRNYENTSQCVGAIEASFIFSNMYKTNCRILEVISGGFVRNYAGFIKTHFIQTRSPILLCGNTDVLAKTVMGINLGPRGVHLLVLEHNYQEKNQTCEKLIQESCVYWKSINDFDDQSSYTFCMPLV